MENTNKTATEARYDIARNLSNGITYIVEARNAIASAEGNVRGNDCDAADVELVRLYGGLDECESFHREATSLLLQLQGLRNRIADAVERNSR